MPGKTSLESIFHTVLNHAGQEQYPIAEEPPPAAAPIPFAPQTGDFVYVLGTTYPETGGSLLEAAGCASGGVAPVPRPEESAALAAAVASAAAGGLLTACLPCGRGGLAAAFAALCRDSYLGLHLDLRKVPKIHTTRPDEILFSETQGRFVLTAAFPHMQAVDGLLQHLPAVKIGFVTTVEALNLTGLSGETLLNLEIAALPKSPKGKP